MSQDDKLLSAYGRSLSIEPSSQVLGKVFLVQPHHFIPHPKPQASCIPLPSQEDMSADTMNHGGKRKLYFFLNVLVHKF